MAYGKELILDLYDCDVSKFNRGSIKEWLVELCKLIDMEREDLHWWDYEGVPKEEVPTEVHLVGTSAVQFIRTSNIIIHTLDLLKVAFIDVFSCKDFDQRDAIQFTKDWFGAQKFESQIVIRGERCKGEGSIPGVGNCLECVSHGKCSGSQWVRQPCFNFKSFRKGTEIL